MGVGETRAEAARDLAELAGRIGDQLGAPAPAGDLGQLLRSARDLHLAADAVEAAAAHAARERGWTWQQIGDALGITRQRAHQRFALTGRLPGLTYYPTTPDTHVSGREDEQ